MVLQWESVLTVQLVNIKIKQAKLAVKHVLLVPSQVLVLKHVMIAQQAIMLMKVKQIVLYALQVMNVHQNQMSQ